MNPNELPNVRAWLLLSLVGILTGTVPAWAEDPLPFVPGSWTLVVLPDTQRYTDPASDPKLEIYKRITQWIADNKQARNIKFVLHEGDITASNRRSHWQVASDAMAVLDKAGVPYSLVPGNHDHDQNDPHHHAPNRDTLMNDYFTVSRCQAMPTFGGVFEPGRTENTYHLFSAGGKDYITVALEWGPRNEAVAWADKVLSQHADRTALIVTHAYTYSDGTRYDWAAKRLTQDYNPHHPAYGFSAPHDGTEDINDGEQLWRKLVSKHKNVRMVFSGHVKWAGARQTAVGDHGQRVHEMVAAYHDPPQGWIRLLEFLPDGRTVQVKTYSPHLDRYMTDDAQQFVLHMAPPPPKLSAGPHLFIDEYLIAETKNLVRVVHQPEKLPQPILAKAESWHQQPLFFLKVMRDAGGNLFRMWYNVKNPGKHPPVCFAYAESKDGIRWERPNLGLIEVDGSTDNNLIEAAFGKFGLFLVDDGPDCPDPARRYKMAHYGPGLDVLFSADGRRFKGYEKNPVIPASKGGKYIISDIIDGCWDPLRSQYLIGCKIEAQGYPGKPHYHREGFRRIVGMTVSKDFVNWRMPWRIVTPDPNNGMEEFYGMQPMVRGNLYLGFLRVLRDDLPADAGGPVMGIGWTELITSRDGERWTRYQQPFLDRNKKPGTWDHAFAWVGDCVTVGNQEYIYYGGYSAGHKIGDRQIGLARLRKNGFVSYDAGATRGTLRTPLVNLGAARMTINAKVDGQLRVRVLDAKGKPLPGFDGSDCARIQGDNVTHPVQWKAPLGSLRGKRIRLEFALEKAQLYAFRLE